MIESVKEKFKQLRMKTCAEHIDRIIEMTSEKNRSLPHMLDYLLDLELESRRVCRVQRLFKESKLTEKTSIDQFDFNFHNSRIKQKNRILNLLGLEFIKQKKDIILIGNPGVGKTFLAKCMAYSAVQAGNKVLFTTAADMINHLIAAEADHSLLKKLRYYQSPDLLVCDEIGYLPLGSQGSNLFFQVISQRHEKKSTVITTNLPFADWGKIFDSTSVATAIVDRLVYNSEVFIMEGSSYRKRIKK
jgi:DNA replication protein DnaC